MRQSSPAGAKVCHLRSPATDHPNKRSCMPASPKPKPSATWSATSSPALPPTDLGVLSQSLLDCAQARLRLDELPPLWRRAVAHLPAPLPARYVDVLEQILAPIDSAAGFTEESCSFSPRDVLQSLQEWLAHAKAWQARGVS